MLFLPSLTEPTPTEGYACYWHFASERQQVYLNRLAGVQGPLTDDPVIARNRFTNAFRASDRVSQYLISRVQYNQKWDWPDTFVRTLIFKIFNRIDTWCHLVAEIGEPDCNSLRDQSVERALEQVAGRRALYSAAYIVPPPRSLSGPKYQRHLALIRRMLDEDAHLEIQSAPTMAAAFHTLRRYDSFGPFLAYQFVTDLNYSVHLNFSEADFVAPGPGSVRGLRKCFSDPGDLSEEDLLRWTADRQDSEFHERGLPWEGLWGRQLQLIDVQNLYCEVDKYTRVALPQLSRYAPGKRIKQRYRPTLAPMTAWFPPKWDINDLISSWSITSTRATDPIVLQSMGSDYNR